MVRQAAAVCLGYPEDEIVDAGPSASCGPGRERSGRGRELRAAARVLGDRRIWQRCKTTTSISLICPASTASTCRTGPTATPAGAVRSWSRSSSATARSGFLVDTRGELPDYLPMVLEYAAVVDPVDGAALLQQYRSSLELLRLALIERSTPYAGVVTAVCATLPGSSPADRKAVMAMAAAGPPAEMVGLDPKSVPLLPKGAPR